MRISIPESRDWPFGERTEIDAGELTAYLASQDRQNGPGREIPVAPGPSPNRSPRSDHPVAPGRIRESAFRDAVVAMARYRGWKVNFVWRSDHSPKGWPDLFMVRGDRAVAIELKVKPNKPTPEQWDWLKALALAGIETHVVYPDDWSMIEEVLT